MNSAFIPVLHKQAIESLLKVINLDSKIKIKRSDKNEIFVLYEDEVWLIDLISKGINYYKYNHPSISVWVPYENIIQFCNEPGFDIKLYDEFLK
jgi:hypothetical protein|uniref:Uncharacterized protein n=1 Tax=Myoviridae sp. ctCo31 TaxID=2825053 RepID=A0A8S5UMM4_9CAUD|nr:MAG TPA: hypothetical protein [Myoviridae sp. ctCo31]